MRILRMMNPGFLMDARCFFGGGTRIVMELGQYRRSDDIDFMVSDPAGLARPSDGQGIVDGADAESGWPVPSGLPWTISPADANLDADAVIGRHQKAFPPGGLDRQAEAGRTGMRFRRKPPAEADLAGAVGDAVA